MMFLKKEKKEKTFLKYKKGKIIEYSQDYSNEDLTQKPSQNQNQNQKIGNTIKLNKPRLLMLIGIIIIIIPLIFMFIKRDTKKYSNSPIKDVVKNNPIVQSDIKNDSEPPVIKVEEKPVKKPIKKESIKPIEKENIEISNLSKSEIINKTNTEFINNYNLLKTDIINFTDNKDSIYIAKKNLKEKKEIVNNQYYEFLKVEDSFVSNKDTFININKRYVNYLNCIDSLLSDLSRSSASNIFNNSLETEHKLIDLQSDF